MAAQHPIEFHGAASCSSMACHHFNGAKGSLRSEFSTWAGDDKHAQAFVVLYNNRSAGIVKNLRGTSAVHATKDALCLKCHSTNDGRTDNASPRFAVSDGVSCEACHGPANRYLTAHYQEGFKQLPAGEKAAKFGLLPTKDLAFRTKLCLSCHVGDNTREVNHDLIAAGHPRLNFEMAGYHGIYNKHWDDDREKSRHPDFYARLWLLGQLVTAKGAVDLLHSRAEGSLVPAEKAGKPWPEFAEYACYACHKDIQVDSPRQKAGFAGRVPGAFPYGTWYLTALSPLNGPEGFVPRALDLDISSLKAAMQRPAPSATDVAVLAKKISDRFASLIDTFEKSKPMDTAQILGFLKTNARHALEKTGRKIGMKDALRIDEMDWDEATQFYLSLAALSQALSDAGAREGLAIRADLLHIKARLKDAFPPGYDSPRKYNPLEPPPMADKLQSLFRALGN